MKRFGVVLALVLALLGPGISAQANEENPCGNHGNGCCTDDAGETFVSVAQTCEAFCSSTAVAVSVAVSECAATCSAEATSICEGAISVAVSECEAKAYARSSADAAAYALSLAKAVSVSVSDATAACAQTCVNECKVPICLDQKTKTRTINGVTYKTTRCRVVG